MSTFERYLTLWGALCIAVGVALGHLLPMLVTIDFATLGQIRQHYGGSG